MAEPYYTTAKALQDKLGVSSAVLPDAEAVSLIEAAEDLIDERLGNYPIDETTGRKIVVAEVEGWQATKLAQATLEVAANLYRDPGVESRQRMKSVSGDVATGGPYGPAYGERADALLSASGLAVRWTHADRRRRGGDRLVQSFDENLR